MAVDTLTYPLPLPDASELDRDLFAEVFGGAGAYGGEKQNQKSGHFAAQWMLDRPEKARLRPDELSVERVRRAHGRFMIAVTDEQAAQIAPFFSGDASASQ